MVHNKLFEGKYVFSSCSDSINVTVLDKFGQVWTSLDKFGQVSDFKLLNVWKEEEEEEEK